MEAVGQGIVYRRFNQFERRISDEQARRLTEKVWATHWARLADRITPGTLLIDCHSFPSDIEPETDICVGFNSDTTRPDESVIGLIVGTFAEAGYRVSLNSPFSNSITPRSPHPYRSVMIELNKQTYLSEQSLRLSQNSIHIRRTILKLYDRLLGNEDIAR